MRHNSARNAISLFSKFVIMNAVNVSFGGPFAAAIAARKALEVECAAEKSRAQKLEQELIDVKCQITNAEDRVAVATRELGRCEAARRATITEFGLLKSELMRSKVDAERANMRIAEVESVAVNLADALRAEQCRCDSLANALREASDREDGMTGELRDLSELYDALEASSDADRTALAEIRRRNAVLRKVKAQKERHIVLLVKEKNRLHDHIASMKKSKVHVLSGEGDVIPNVDPTLSETASPTSTTVTPREMPRTPPAKNARRRLVKPPLPSPKLKESSTYNPSLQRNYMVIRRDFLETQKQLKESESEVLRLKSEVMSLRNRLRMKEHRKSPSPVVRRVESR